MAENKEKPLVSMIGEDGNIFNLMSIAKRGLVNAGQRAESEEMIKRINTEAKSYDEALWIIQEYVDIM